MLRSTWNIYQQTKMKALVLSDLHLEHWNEADNAALLNDINYAKVDCFLCAGDLCESRFLHMLNSFIEALTVPCFYVMGNHDAYGTSFESAKNVLMRCSRNYSNFNLLDNSSIDFMGYTIIGSPLYTDFNLYGYGAVESTNSKYLSGIADFSSILANDEFLKPADYVSLHLRAKEYLENALEHVSDKKKTIVLTHWVPYVDCISSKFYGNSFNPYFTVNCHELFMLEPKYWIYGHTHEFGCTKVNQTTCICNPRGYPGENKKRKFKDFIVEFY